MLSLSLFKLAILGAFTLGCGDADVIEGNGDLATETRALAAFHALVIADDLSAEIAIGPSAVSLELDENLVKDVATDVRDGVLHIGRRPGGPALRPSAGARVRIVAPRIDAITASDASTVSAITAGIAMTVTTLDAARVDLTGAAPEVFIRSSGASRVDCQTAATAASIASGDTSDVRVRVSERLAVQAGDAAKVTVLGNPTSREVDAKDAATVVFPE